jgi:hypothetical protein
LEDIEIKLLALMRPFWQSFVFDCCFISCLGLLYYI